MSDSLTCGCYVNGGGKCKVHETYCKFLKRGNDKTCGRFDNPHNTVILKTLCTKCGEVTQYALE